MKNLVLSIATFAATLGLADPHAHHPSHNMVLHGTQEVFASHIVYKQPHNYQVIVQVQLSETEMATYLAEKKEFPADTFIYFLDPGDISLIQSAQTLSGKLVRKDAAGTRHEILPNITLSKDNFEVLFFNELPLSLEADLPV